MSLDDINNVKYKELDNLHLVKVVSGDSLYEYLTINQDDQILKYVLFNDRNLNKSEIKRCLRSFAKSYWLPKLLPSNYKSPADIVDIFIKKSIINSITLKRNTFHFYVYKYMMIRNEKDYWSMYIPLLYKEYKEYYIKHVLTLNEKIIIHSIQIDISPLKKEKVEKVDECIYEIIKITNNLK